MNRFLVILLLALSIKSASAEQNKLSHLLAGGYEVKAAYGVQYLKKGETSSGSTITGGQFNSLEVGQVLQYLVLQKGSSVYICDNYQVITTQAYNCFSARDAD